MAAVCVQNLKRAFGNRKACDDVTFEVPEGAFLAIFGPNGAGKTTLLRMLATLSRPNSGSINIMGLDALENPDEVRANLGYISHASMLYPDLTAEENLVLTGKLYGVAHPKKRAVELLDAIGLKHRRKDSVRTFSRGMTQRTSIARALMNDPEVLLLDEPHSGLDPHASAMLDELLEQEKQRRTCIMVSHDLQRGHNLSSHIMILNKGKIDMFVEKAQLPLEQLEAAYAKTAQGRQS